MDKAYDHQKFENKIYEAWEKSGLMRADENSDKEPFTIVLPPPNVTGQLHLGHSAMLAIEDIMIRHQKMSGKEVCWVPGTDHAAIATENVVIKHLGLKSREELSREEFLKECRKFAQEKHDRIVHQIRKMGAWLDWSREAYTFDEERNFAVNTIFEQLYNDGLIVRGHRLINWSVGAQSVLADDEVEWGEEVEPFYYIKCGEFIIGTVRPETKCADSPLIVNPDAEYVRVKYTPKLQQTPKSPYQGTSENPAKKRKFIPYDKNLTKFARENRKNPTPAEKKMWYEIIDKLKKEFPNKWLRQRIIDNYIVDFYSPSLKLVVEIDGDSHFTKEGIEYDKIRTETLNKYGLNVIRFTNDEIINSPDAVYFKISKFIKEKNSPLAPLIEGGNPAKFENNLDERDGGSINTFILVKNCWKNPEERKKVLNLLDEDGTWEVLETMTGNELVEKIGEFEYDTYAGKRKFVVMADEVVDPNKGSGAMTISCNHSADDYDLGKRKKLDKYFFDKIDFAGKMLKIAGEAEGMSVKEARKFAGKKMEEMGLLTGIDKNYSHRVPLCYRSGCVVEPMVSPQWFISVEKEFTDKFTGEKTTLKKLTQKAVREKNVKIIPARFEKIYFQWIDNLRDWCISRQIWWGHQIPVFYCQDCQAENVFDAESTKNPANLCCKKCGSNNLKQDEDTLDTWFSSALWPFSTLGWPDENSRDFQKFYPNSMMETGHDILFFWVARMIMFARYATGKYPFETVYLHGLVCDEKGQKMSKSKGNGIDPLELIEEVGADAVRLSLVIGTTPGNNIPIGKNKIKGYRNFVNKLWNAGRFVQMQLDSSPLAPLIEGGNPANFENSSNKRDGGRIKAKSLADKWIADRFTQISREINEHLNKYEISLAGDKIYHFIWDEFCDWYLEAHKVEPNPLFLREIFLDILKLAHPLVPFITESLWKVLTNDDTFIVEQSFPQPDFEDKKSREIFGDLQEIVSEIRRIRAENKVNPKDKLNIEFANEINPETLKLIEHLAKVANGKVDKKQATKIFHRLAGHGAGNSELLIEIPVDEKAVAAEIKKLENLITSLKNRLANKNYVQSAPKELVAESREKLKNAEEKLAKLKSN